MTKHRRIDLPNGMWAIAELHENGLSVSFDVYDEKPDDHVWHGFVKWDGCSNWSPGGEGDHVMAHFCDEKQERAFGELLVTLRREALRIMGTRAIFTVDGKTP